MTTFLSVPILILLPVIAAIIILSPALYNNQIFTRRFATAFSVIQFFYSILFFLFYNPSDKISECTSCLFKPEFKSVIPILNNETLNQIGIHVAFGADSLSVVMIILTTLITLLAIISSKLYITKHHKYFYALILLLESILLGIFTTTNMFVFFALWELELIPMYLLISIWGNKNARKSAMKFVLYTFGGSLFMLLGILLIYFTNFAMSGVLTSDMTLINMNNTNVILQLLMSVCLLIGFGVKVPFVPLHRWLADTHTNASTPVSMILAAVLLKLGIYGIIRFNLGLLPLGFAVLAPLLGLLAIVNIVYGAALAYYQTNIKRLIAYSSISQMGIIVLGLAALTKLGYIGAIYHSISHGVVVLGLFLVAGIIKLKFRTGNIKKLSGIACIAPRLYGFAMLISLAAIGVPFLSGFIGEFLTIYGSITSGIQIFKLYAVLALVILLLSALYILKFLHESFYGLLPEKFKNVQDIAVHEFVVLAVVSVIILILGCFPFIVVNFIS